MDTRKAGQKGAEKRWGEQNTKVKAIAAFLTDFGGAASWTDIYENIGRYHALNKETDWKAGLRGVVYREIKNKRTFKMVAEGVVGLR